MEDVGWKQLINGSLEVDKGDVPSGTGEPRPERDSGKRDYTQMRERDLKALEIISKTRPTWATISTSMINEVKPGVS